MVSVSGFDVDPGGDVGCDGGGEAGGAGLLDGSDEAGGGTKDGVELLISIGFDIDGV